MKLFDCHVHLEKGRDSYDLRGVSRWNVIFNSIESYRAYHSLAKKDDTLTVIFDYRNALDEIIRELTAGRVQALKIHNRTQQIAESDYEMLEEKLGGLDVTLPVVYDAFYYGDDLAHQPSLPQLIRLARKFPKIPFVVAHCGGIKLLEYFVHLRPLSNIFYDLSFSLQYLEDSSCFTDLIKLIRYTDKSRILFGSDYPWASPQRQLKILKGIFRRLHLSPGEQAQILYSNADRLFRHARSL